MTGSLIIEVAEAGDDCILKLFRTGDRRHYQCRLNVWELQRLVDALTRARQWMRPNVPPEFTRSADCRFVPDLWIDVPQDQRRGTGAVTYLVRHPAHGWLASQMLPSRAYHLGGALLAFANMAHDKPPGH